MIETPCELCDVDGRMLADAQQYADERVVRLAFMQSEQALWP
ncbi:hypothetical protein ACFQ4M_10695 [Thauera mechernichensis]|uniref:Uncharacterized protein n=1 Tax=Thauera mechernichensis TaxID=82788 RepID=A0ABW3WFL3_9RHOO|nr:hypothetical protein [Thauera mechernichensis]MDG3066179.1 hypothetical protein [Thauera mechernichensis]